MSSKNPSLWRANSRILIMLSAAESAHLGKLRLSPECNLVFPGDCLEYGDYTFA